MSSVSLSAFEQQVVDYFCDGVRLLGLPKSLGEIYGLLYVTPRPLSLDDLVEKLKISKGSVSQGLKTLRELGAVHEVPATEGVRRTFYEPDVELKRLVGGFIKEQVRPHVSSGEAKLSRLQEAVRAEQPSELRDFYEERVEKLERWSKRARILLPVIQKFLGS